MALIVQKYGGTSVADPDRIRAVAEHVAFTKRHGDDVVVVVSAMGKATDNLLKLANDVSRTQPGREMDMLLTTGERVSMALLCMALADVGVDAMSFTGSQVGIITDTVHMKAKILEVKGDRVREALAAGQVCVVSVTIPACEPVKLNAGSPCSMIAMHSSAMEIRSPAVSSMSISRSAGEAEISWARRTRSSVVLPMAETTTTTSSPPRRVATTCSATARMRSGSATEEPPNFWTTRPTGNDGTSGVCADSR